jgi:threonine/homoserine/homoserine lactone efflux protein
MGVAIGQMLPAAIGVAISPLPIVAVVLMLVTPRGRINGLAFLLGWVAGLAIVGIVVLTLAGGADASEDGAPADWVSWLKLVLGLLLLLLAAKQWQGRPRPGQEPRTPKWMSALDTFTPVKAAGVGALLSAVNPKNLVLAVGGAAAIASTGISAGDQAVVWIVFIVVASLGVGVPVVLDLALGERAKTLLDDLRTWMSAHNAAIMAVVLLILGVKLLGDGISGLSA